MKIFQNKHMFYISFFYLLFFLLSSLLLKVEKLVVWDTSLGRNMYQIIELDTFFIFLSYIGSRDFFYPVIIILSVFFLWRKRFSFLLLVWGNLLGVRILNIFLKGFFTRERPELTHIVEASYYSFPSGHAMNSMAFYGLLAFLLISITQNRILKIVVLLLFSIVILLIGYSRIYLGVHFPLDVFAGFCAGASWLFLVIGLWWDRGTGTSSLCPRALCYQAI